MIPFFVTPINSLCNINDIYREHYSINFSEQFSEKLRIRLQTSWAVVTNSSVNGLSLQRLQCDGGLLVYLVHRSASKSFLQRPDHAHLCLPNIPRTHLWFRLQICWACLLYLEDIASSGLISCQTRLIRTKPWLWILVTWF